MNNWTQKAGELQCDASQHDIEMIRSCYAGGSYFFMNNDNEIQYMNNASSDADDFLTPLALQLLNH